MSKKSKAKFFMGFIKENFLVLVESKKDLDARTKIACDRQGALDLMAGFEIAMAEQPGFERGWNFLRTDTTLVTMIRRKDYEFLGGVEDDGEEEDKEEEDEEDDDDGEPFNELFDVLYDNKKSKKYNELVREFYTQEKSKNGKEAAKQKDND